MEPAEVSSDHDSLASESRNNHYPREPTYSRVSHAGSNPNRHALVYSPVSPVEEGNILRGLYLQVPGENHDREENGERQSQPRAQSPASGWRPQIPNTNASPAVGNTTSAPNSPLSSSSTFNIPRKPVPKSVVTTQPKPAFMKWQPFIIMISLFLVGVAAAIGHHVYYSSLDRQLAGAESRQAWTIQIGNGFAFLCKTCLVSSVASAFTFNSWRTIRKRAFTPPAINMMLNGHVNPFFALNLEMLSRGTVSFLLAAAVWTMPIAVLFTPATLTVKASPLMSLVSVAVPTVNFTASANYVSGSSSDSLGVPRSNLARMTYAAATSASILPCPAPFPKSTYDYDFIGPAIRCTAANATVVNFLRVQAESAGEFFASSWDFIHDPAEHEESWDHIYIFAMQPRNGFPFPTKTTCQKDACWTCELYNTSYSTRWTYEDGVQSISVKEPQYLNRVVGNGTDGGGPDIDIPEWKRVQEGQRTAYAAWMKSITTLIAGTTHSGISFDDSDHKSASINRTLVAQTALWGSFDAEVGEWDASNATKALTRGLNFGALLEELSRNITLSLFSNSDFWPKQLDFAIIERSEIVNVYSYNRFNLLISYGSIILASFIGVIVGTFGLISVEDSMATSNDFSTLFLATRNPDLDDALQTKYAKGNSGGRYAKLDRKVKLQYGETRVDANSREYKVFGIRHDVTNP